MPKVQNKALRWPSLEYRLKEEIDGFTDSHKQQIYQSLLSVFPIPPKGIDHTVYRVARDRVPFLYSWWKARCAHDPKFNEIFLGINTSPVWKAIAYFEASLFLSAGYGNDSVFGTVSESFTEYRVFHSPHDPGTRAKCAEARIAEVDALIKLLKRESKFATIQNEKDFFNKIISVLEAKHFKLSTVASKYTKHSILRFSNGTFKKVHLSTKENEELYVIGNFVYRFRKVAHAILKIKKSTIDDALIILLNSMYNPTRKEDPFTLHSLKFRQRIAKEQDCKDFEKWYENLFDNLRPIIKDDSFLASAKSALNKE